MAKYFAANRVCAPEGDIVCGVVVVEHGIVRDIFRLERELPLTTWLGGTIHVKRTPIGLQAYKDGKLIED